MQGGQGKGRYTDAMYPVLGRKRHKGQIEISRDLPAFGGMSEAPPGALVEKYRALATELNDLRARLKSLPGK